MARIEAKEGSFDFSGVYKEVRENEFITSKLNDVAEIPYLTNIFYI